MSWGFGVGGGEELRLQSREYQELSAAAVAGQLILKMSSEHQTVDHRKKVMGNDHTTRSLCDFAKTVVHHDTNFVNNAQNANAFTQNSD